LSASTKVSAPNETHSATAPQARAPAAASDGRLATVGVPGAICSVMLSLRFSLCGRVHFPRCSVSVLFGAFLATGCGGPTAPQTLGPILVCPANLTVVSLDGNATPVIYEPPQVVAGEPPVKTTCNPPNGAIFVLGNSTVTCTATDAVLRTGSCAFTVTLAVPPKLAATSFVAFGNSITEGKNALGDVLLNNYPANLRTMLVARYTAQAQVISVLNKGAGGESVITGSDRIQTVLDADRPEVVLLEEGVNDLLGGDPLKVDEVIEALGDIVHKAKARGVRVFLATLIPGRPGQLRSGAVPLIPPTNDKIRQLALSEGVTLVDLYQGFGGSPDPYIDVDGLHPNEAGYRKIAEIFFDAIKATLELQPGVASSMELVRNMPVPGPPARQPRWGGVPSQHPVFSRLR
jgi:lysophospholipase L1-like esterase